MRRRAALFALGASVLLAAALLSAFPGQRFRFAFVIATGVGRVGLQRQIDRLEEQAIARGEFTADDRQFLSDFYRTLATGGRLSIVAAQTGKLMHHYLDGSGREYELEPEIFTENI